MRRLQQETFFTLSLIGNNYEHVTGSIAKFQFYFTNFRKFSNNEDVFNDTCLLMNRQILSRIQRGLIEINYHVLYYFMLVIHCVM